MKDKSLLTATAAAGCLGLLALILHGLIPDPASTLAAVLRTVAAAGILTSLGIAPAAALAATKERSGDHNAMERAILQKMAWIPVLAALCMATIYLAANTAPPITAAATLILALSVAAYLLYTPHAYFRVTLHLADNRNTEYTDWTTMTGVLTLAAGAGAALAIATGEPTNWNTGYQILVFGMVLIALAHQAVLMPAMTLKWLNRPSPSTEPADTQQPPQNPAPTERSEVRDTTTGTEYRDREVTTVNPPPDPKPQATTKPEPDAWNMPTG